MIMACACKNKKRTTYKVKLAGGLTVNKSTEAEAVAFAAKHPGATVVKPAA
jgi:glutathione synthase/RimK-type ligase-like ATP-grasp enzyme